MWGYGLDWAGYRIGTGGGKPVNVVMNLQVP